MPKTINKKIKSKYTTKPKTTRKEINDPKAPSKIHPVTKPSTKPIIKSMFSNNKKVQCYVLPVNLITGV